MTKILRYTLTPLLLIAFAAAGHSQVVMPGDDDLAIPREKKVQLDDLSQDLADEYLDILEQLQEIVEDYSEYFADLDPQMREAHPVSFETFKDGLTTGRYVDNFGALLQDLQEFLPKLKAMEKYEHESGQEMKCCRIIRNLRREMSMLYQLAHEFGETLESRKSHGHGEWKQYSPQWEENFRVYIKDALKKLEVTLEEQEVSVEKEALRQAQEALKRAQNLPNVPRVPKPPRVTVGKGSSVGVGVAPRGHGEVGLVREFEDTLRVTDRGALIRVSNPLGYVYVTGWDEDYIATTYTVEIKADSRTREKEFVDRAELNLGRSNKGYDVQVQLPHMSDPDTRVLTSQLVVQLPANNPVEVQNAYGELYVVDLVSSLTARGEYSEIQVESIYGATSITNSMGSITVEDIRGDLSVENSYSPIEISSCDSRNIQITNAYSSVTLENSRGTAKITNSGAVEVDDHVGNVEIENSYGMISAEHISGDFVAINAYQPLVVDHVSGSATLRNSYALINVEHVGGTLVAVNQFGKIAGSNLSGPVKVTNQNGTIHLAVDERLAGESEVTATFGTIDLSLAEDADVLMIAEAVNGEIRTLLPIQVVRDGMTHTAEHRFGSAKNRLSINGKNSSIVISRAD